MNLKNHANTEDMINKTITDGINCEEADANWIFMSFGNLVSPAFVYP